MPPAVSASKIFRPMPRLLSWLRRREKLCANHRRIPAAWTRCPGARDRTDIKLVVEPAGSVEGKIIAEGSNQPPPVARLTLQPDRPGFVALSEREPAQSGADGAFHINDVAAGSYRIRAVFGTNAVPEWVADTVPVSVESGQTTRDVQVTDICGMLSLAARCELGQLALRRLASILQTGSYGETAFVIWGRNIFMALLCMSIMSSCFCW